MLRDANIPVSVPDWTMPIPAFPGDTRGENLNVSKKTFRSVSDKANRDTPVAIQYPHRTPSDLTVSHRIVSPLDRPSLGLKTVNRRVRPARSLF